MCYFNFGLKTSSPGMVSISQSLFTSTLESRNSLFSGLLLFRGKKKKKHIRTLDEICNPSYTNLRSPRRCNNLIPKQAAKRGNSPGVGRKRLSFLSFFLLCLNFWNVFLGFPLFTWVLPLPLPITERLPAPWRWPWCSCSHWTWERASPPNDAPQCD